MVPKDEEGNSCGPVWGQPAGVEGSSRLRGQVDAEKTAMGFVPRVRTSTWGPSRTRSAKISSRRSWALTTPSGRTRQRASRSSTLSSATDFPRLWVTSSTPSRLILRN